MRCHNCHGSGVEPDPEPDLIDSRDESVVKKDAKATKAAAEDGMSRAEAHANKVWKLVVSHVIRELAEERNHFTSDDVRVRMAADHPSIQTHNKSALGPLLKNAAKAEIIRSSGRTRSQLPVTHGKWVTIWESRIHADLPH